MGYGLEIPCIYHLYDPAIASGQKGDEENFLEVKRSSTLPKILKMKYLSN